MPSLVASYGGPGVPGLDGRVCYHTRPSNPGTPGPQKLATIDGTIRSRVLFLSGPPERGPSLSSGETPISTVDSDKDQYLAALVARHGATLEKYLARKLDSPEDAAEVAQEAFLRLHRMQQPENLDNARAFLYQVASNLAVDQLRRRQLHFRFLNLEKAMGTEGEPADINASAASPEQIFGARERLATIYQAVDELPFRVKQAFLLHRKNGMSYGAIAQQMDVSVSSVEKYILQALKHCRERLASYYPEDDEKGKKS